MFIIDQQLLKNLVFIMHTKRIALNHPFYVTLLDLILIDMVFKKKNESRDLKQSLYIFIVANHLMKSKNRILRC